MPKASKKIRAIVQVIMGGNTRFRSWLGQYPTDKTQAFCKLCDQKLKPKKCVLLNHLKSEKHEQMSKTMHSN